MNGHALDSLVRAMVFSSLLFPLPIVLPPGNRVVEVLLLAFLCSAAEKDRQAVAVLAGDGVILLVVVSFEKERNPRIMPSDISCSGGLQPGT